MKKHRAEGLEQAEDCEASPENEQGCIEASLRRRSWWRLIRLS
jgi:hypothetical protein